MGGAEQPVVGVVHRVDAAVVPPLLVGDAVEHRVAGDLDGAAEADRSVGGGLEVAERLAADVVGRGAVVAAVEVVAGVDGGGGGHHLECRPGRALALDGPVEQRVVGVLVGQGRVVAAGDAADPHVRVVVGGRGHRDDAARVVLDDDGRAGVRLEVAARHVVVLVPRRLHGADQLALDDRLHPGVERGDQVGAGLGALALRLAEHAAELVHFVTGHARVAAQVAVVGPFQAGTPDLVGTQQRRVGVLGLLDLLVGDRREVAEDLRGVRALRRGVAAHGGRLGAHAGEVLGALADLERLLRGGLVGDGDGLVGRAVPAGLGRLGVAQPHLVGDVLHRHVQQLGEVGEHRLAVVRQPAQLGTVDGDHEPGLVVGDGHAARVEDGAAHRGLHHLLHVVARRLGRELVALPDLEIPQAPAEREQQREHQYLDDDETDRDARCAPGLRNVGHGTSPRAEPVDSWRLTGASLP